mgnify:CR=1 FL=1
MKNAQRLSVGWARLVFELLKREGLNASELFKEFDLEEAQLSNPNAYFNQDSFTGLWQEASRLSGNLAIGLRMGENPTVSAFDAYSYSLMSSATLRESMERAIRYQKIMGSAAQLSSENTEDGCCIILSNNDNKAPEVYQGFDAALALRLFATRFFTQKQITPTYVEFMHDKPQNIRPYQSFFQCPLRFSAARYSTCLINEDLDTPMIFANESMAIHHEEMVIQTIKSHSTAKLSEQVSDIIHKKLPSGEPTINSVATLLNISSRTLQRRLKEEHLSFLTLLNSTRKELAHSYTTNNSITLQEITFLLGFTDHSNFYRAFKRWYGCAPGEYRSRQLTTELNATN